MKRIKNIHPGAILLEEFLTPLNITANRLAKDINTTQIRISEILKGKRKITANTALRLSVYFEVSAKFWLGLQNDFDIEEKRLSCKEDLKSIKKHNVENGEKNFEDVVGLF